MAQVLKILTTLKCSLSVITEEIPKYAMVTLKLGLGAIGGTSVMVRALAKTNGLT